MTKTTKVALVAAALLCAAATPLEAQLAWDTPRMIGPESPGGFGVYVMQPDALPGDKRAAFATWALPGMGGSVILRGGVGEGVAEEEAAFGGLDLRAPIARHTDSQPFDIEWTAGAGFGVGEYILVSVPVAISVGRSWSSGSVWFAPYLSLGATADYRHGDSDLRPDEEFEVQPTAGVGIDLSFDPGRRFVVRAATALGDRQALAVGLAVTGGPRGGR